MFNQSSPNHPFYSTSYFFSAMNFALFLWFSIFLLTTKVSPTLGHIGQPCSFLKFCWPLNIHIYCDDNNTCRCRPETPVVVGPHQCKRNKSHGDKCSTDQECIYSDNYSFCDSNLCNCVANYTYDPYLMKCMHNSIQQRASFNVFFSMLSSSALWFIFILIALFISIPCCLAFLYHCVCYEKSSGDSSLCQDSRYGAAVSRANEEGRENNGNLRNNGEGGEGGGADTNTNRTSLHHHDELSSHQSYDLSCLDEPPPSYEEACKRLDIQITNQQSPKTANKMTMEMVSLL